MAYYSGQGRLYVGVRTAGGQAETLIPVGNVPKLETSIDITKFEHKESMTGARATDLTVVKEKKPTFTFTIEDITAANLALGLWGTTTDVAAATGSAFTVTAKLGFKVPIRNAVNLTTIVVKDVTDTTTYEFGASATAVDSKNGYYDAVYGSITVFDAATQTAKGAAASIANNDVLHITANVGVSTLVSTLTESSVERFLRFEGLNTVDDSEVLIEIPRASIDPMKGLALINEDIGSFDITGNILYDSLQLAGQEFMTIRQL